ncbi:MAG: hypothetical protein U9Q20_04980 [Campylobacterota bacterium]|nr:hypothetical protein [Campylobacterota bacterium]
MINKALKIFFIVDFGVILFCILSGNMSWLLNTQIAFFSSLFVTLGSYMGYIKNVEKRVEYQVNDDDNYDELDKMDDKYDLYSPDIEEEIKENPTKEEIQEAMKPIKQNYFKNFKSGFSGMASFYRLAGYIGLIVGFFYLNNNGYLHIYSYIFGFIIVPISALVFAFAMKKEEKVN